MKNQEVFDKNALDAGFFGLGLFMEVNQVWLPESSNDLEKTVEKDFFMKHFNKILSSLKCSMLSVQGVTKKGDLLNYGMRCFSLYFTLTALAVFLAKTLKSKNSEFGFSSGRRFFKMENSFFKNFKILGTRLFLKMELVLNQGVSQKNRLGGLGESPGFILDFLLDGPLTFFREISRENGVEVLNCLNGLGNKFIDKI